MHTLGTLEELPADYRDALAQRALSPLWPQMRNLLPRQWPAGPTQACHWSYAAVRPLLLQAGRLTPVEKAERRVLVLSDPGRGPDAMQISAAIYCGMQLLLPGEHAPPHRHTPSAARIVVEGRGAVTIVDGERCTMEAGDVILTPGGMWHDHVHEGSEPVIWLDALDLPLFVYLEGSYAQEPSRSGEPQAFGPSPELLRERYPRLRFPWNEMRERLLAAAKPAGVADIDYVNPKTGGSPLPTLGFTGMHLRGGADAAPPRRSCSQVFHVVEGEGESTVNGRAFAWTRGDTFSAPVFATVAHRAAGHADAFLIAIHDRPLQDKLGFYEERPA
jgi:gentisate 1,2-dioxygenase